MKFLTALVLFVTTSAFAIEVKVAEVDIDSFRPDARVSYSVNRNDGRAWIEMEHTDHTTGYGDGGMGPKIDRLKVEGLAFNKETSKITFTHEGQVFECADVFKKWYGVVIKQTGCNLKLRDAKVTVDDGYRMYRRWVHQAWIITK